MKNTTVNLPNDPTRLKQMVLLGYEEIELLREKIRVLQSKLFGPKTEKLAPEVNALQGKLFEVNETEADPAPEPEDEFEENDGPMRRKRGRRPLPKDLPRQDVIHDLGLEDKVCACGSDMSRIGEEVTEELEYQPATLRVLRHVRYKYTCKACQGLDSEGGTIKLAPAPARLIPGSIAGPGLLAHVLTAKFADGLPFYRVSRQFQRLGLDLKRATLCYWARKIGEKLQPLWDLLNEELKTAAFLQLDETTLQVLGEEGRKNQTKSYMWVMRGRPPDHPIICYRYDPTRSASVAKKLLEGYGGIVQTDGYKGYDFLDKWDGVRHAGCWAHMRRYFATIVKTQKSRKGNKETLAEAAVRMIREIYALERQARADHCSFAEVRAMRQHLAKPKVEEFHDWLKDLEGKTPPKSLLGEAVNYALKQWPRLLVYLDDGALPMDTNLLENAIRPFVVGRKAWLFSGAPEGAQASAVLYSVLETAKANGWEPWAYFTHLFRHLPEAGDDPDRIRALLPIYPPETQKTDSAPQPPATTKPAK